MSEQSQEFWNHLILEKITPTGFAVPRDRFTELWFNPLNHASLRLTKFGLQMASARAGLTNYVVGLDTKILPRHFLLLERACRSPYYIKKLNELVVFDEQTAVMIELHAGDFTAYFTNQQQYG